MGRVALVTQSCEFESCNLQTFFQENFLLQNSFIGRTPSKSLEEKVI